MMGRTRAPILLRTLRHLLRTGGLPPAVKRARHYLKQVSGEPVTGDTSALRPIAAATPTELRSRCSTANVAFCAQRRHRCPSNGPNRPVFSAVSATAYGYPYYY